MYGGEGVRGLSVIRLTMFDDIYRLTQNCCQEVRTQNYYREVRVFAFKNLRFYYYYYLFSVVVVVFNYIYFSYLSDLEERQ